MSNLFDKVEADKLIARINSLTPETKGDWGKMDVAQMLAHCNVPYEQVFKLKQERVTGLKKFFLKLFVKPIVVGDKPYKRNGRTAPAFLINSKKDFFVEKSKVIDYIKKTQQLGAPFFEDKESTSFGKLSSAEWNNLFYKHLDHHLIQFGA